MEYLLLWFIFRFSRRSLHTIESNMFVKSCCVMVFISMFILFFSSILCPIPLAPFRSALLACWCETTKHIETAMGVSKKTQGQSGYDYASMYITKISSYISSHPFPLCVCVHSFVDLFKLIIMFALFIHIIFMQTHIQNTYNKYINRMNWVHPASLFHHHHSLSPKRPFQYTHTHTHAIYPLF